MGAKTWMLVYADTDAREALKTAPPLDREATLGLANSLFPDEKLISIGDGNLAYTNPPDSEVYIGAFAKVSVVAATEFGIDYPSALPQRFLAAGACRIMYLHAMHSVVDWCAFAQWNNGRLVRSLSLSADSGIIEDIGQRLPFEEPYWSGQHPAADDDDEDDEYPFPFHPLDLGEAALREFFGYQLEGFLDSTLLDPHSMPLIRYKRTSV
jgi:hypothetical protein